MFSGNKNPILATLTTPASISVKKAIKNLRCLFYVRSGSLEKILILKKF